MKPMGQRQKRVAEEIRHVIARALLRGDVPTILPTRELTVLDVWVSADLRLARVVLTGHANLDSRELVDTANGQLARPLRKVLAREARLKNTPEIEFLPAEG